MRLTDAGRALRSSQRGMLDEYASSPSNSPPLMSPLNPMAASTLTPLLPHPLQDSSTVALETARPLSVEQAVSASFEKLSKNLESSVVQLVSKTILDRSAWDSRKRPFSSKNSKATLMIDWCAVGGSCDGLRGCRFAAGFPPVRRRAWQLGRGLRRLAVRFIGLPPCPGGVLRVRRHCVLGRLATGGGSGELFPLRPVRRSDRGLSAPWDRGPICLATPTGRRRKEASGRPFGVFPRLRGRSGWGWDSRL
ncbi:hypothetical protein NDU88_008539 [Pleurodeles waltl]|uniref:Uncharacterized protein n=1 Tax=Pleurodeles waltl TaxID=8319 RepID=A0AAV7RU32_PLEWA|nr:hypothetical protein NDU88_008539 [Pleurodeles waltl]